MTELKHLQEIPYKNDEMTSFAIDARLPLLGSKEDMRELCDLTIQRYLDVQPMGDESAIDNVEDTIHHLMNQDKVPAREDDTLFSVAERLAAVRNVGAEALREENHPILSRPVNARKSRSLVEKAADRQEAIAASYLDNTIIDLVTDDKIDDITAQGLMLLFQLRKPPNPYSIEQRRSLSVVTQGFYSILKTAMKDEPTIRKKNTNELRDPELRKGMEVFGILNELLKLPDTRTQHPLKVYLDSRSRSSMMTGGNHFGRETVLNSANLVIRKSFGLTSSPTS